MKVRDCRTLGIDIDIFTATMFIMSVAISFKDVSHHQYFEGFSCEIESGSSALIITSGENESAALTRFVTGLSCPSHGSVLVDGREVSGLEPSELYRFRRQIGVVPSHGGLVSNLKLWENITLPLVYHSGGVTAEEERTARDCLERLGYSGGLMAMPAHLSPQDRRSAALARMILTQPKIILYSNCIDDASTTARSTFIRISGEFHAAAAGRTSVYLSSSPELAAELPVDKVFRVHEPVPNVSRSA
jgi:ABC-type transporter Mla maintaining outer membrane lipid asymmetry ATPase subunit MlaF